MTMAMSPKLKAAGLTLFAVLLWGFAPVGTRYLVGNTHAALAPLPFIALRYLLASICFVPVLWGELRRWPRQELLFGALCGLVGVTGYNLLNVSGSRTVTAGMAGLLNGSEPLLIVLLLSLQRRRWPSRGTLVASGVGVFGIGLLALGAGPAVGDVKGILFILGGAGFWAVYCVLAVPLLQRRGTVAITAITVITGTLPLLAAGGGGIPEIVTRMSLGQWEIVGALSLTTVIAILAWNKGSAALGAEQSGWFLYLLPVVGAAGGTILLGEPLTLMELSGGGLIMLSVFLSQRK